MAGAIREHDSEQQRNLRQESIGQMRQHRCADMATMGSDELKTLIHDLDSRQVELEAQNEQLRLAADQLSQTCDSYQDLYEFAPVAYLTLDAGGTVLKANLAALKLCGRNRNDIVGQPFESLLIENHCDRSVTLLRDSAVSDVPQITELRTKQGEGPALWVNASVSRLICGGGLLSGFRVTMTDISRRKAAEELLRQRVEEVETLMGVAPVAIWVSHDRECREITGNRLANEFYEAEEDENVSATTVPEWRKFYSNGRELKDSELPMQLAARTGHEVRDCELEVRLPSGRRMIMLGNASPLRDADGEIRGVIGVFMNITERKEIEVQLRQARDDLERRVAERTAELQARAEQLSRLSSDLTLTEQRERQRLAQILHDHVQQLLVGASMHVDLARTSLPDGQVREKLDLVHAIVGESIEATRSLSHDLYPPVLHEAGLVPALEWLARRMSSRHGLSVEVDADSQAEPDGDDMRMLLFDSVRELLLNVIKHAAADSARIELTRCENEKIVLTVSDSGVGFDPQRAAGSAQQSFGLFNLRERLALLGGELEISSSPGCGTRVSLMAPLPGALRPSTDLLHSQGNSGNATDRPGSAAAGQAGDDVATDGNNIRLLLADDHRVLRQGLASLLGQQAGIEVVGEAENGQMAVEMAHQLLPDVVIMDISMPILSGIEATKRLCAELPQIRIVGVSMHDDVDMARKMLGAGATAYVPKSGPTEAIVAAIKSCRNRCGSN